MSALGTDANETSDTDSNHTDSKRQTQSDAERALEIIIPTAADFQRKLGDLIQSRKNFRLRLEVIGDGGLVSDVDLNEFTKRRPQNEPQPVEYDDAEREREQRQRAR